MKQVILETPRLLLREMDISDMDSLRMILQDEKMMYAYNGAFDERETSMWMQKQLKCYKDFGFGLWAIVLKKNGEMIGQCGITMQEYNDMLVPEVGYLLAYKH